MTSSASKTPAMTVSMSNVTVLKFEIFPIIEWKVIYNVAAPYLLPVGCDHFAGVQQTIYDAYYDSTGASPC